MFGRGGAVEQADSASQALVEGIQFLGREFPRIPAAESIVQQFIP
jgi:hypothetical protein